MKIQIIYLLSSFIFTAILGKIIILPQLIIESFSLQKKTNKRIRNVMLEKLPLCTPKHNS